MDYLALMEVNWQEAFNALLTLVVAGLGYWFKTEFMRMNKRIDEMKADNVSAHKDFRVDHISCQQSLPNNYVTRREYEASQETIRESLTGIQNDIREIFRLLRDRV